MKVIKTILQARILKKAMTGFFCQNKDATVNFLERSTGQKVFGENQCL